MDKCLNPTIDMIANLIEIENAHINTNHPDFIGSADSLLNLFQTDEEQDGNARKSKTYGLLDKPESPAEEIEVIADKEEEKTGGYLSGAKDYLWGSKKKAQTPIKEEAKTSAAPKTTETMISKAQTRNQKEEFAMKERQDANSSNDKELNSSHLVYQEPDFFTFDR